jgi:hypothetical protein
MNHRYIFLGPVESSINAGASTPTIDDAMLEKKNSLFIAKERKKRPYL